ncbi:fimbrial protein [Neisseriaceae bacterium TC5R-5]|nr:fimbrial protein [Neisseriaceae bacterium TC5R-5]
MKNGLLQVLVCLLIFLILPAHADNTIQFEGEVTANSCVVSINNDAVGATTTVTLPMVRTADLPANLAPSANVGATKFTVKISGCTVNSSQATPIKVRFVSSATTSSGNLGNTGTATNVRLQLYDPANPSTGFNLNANSGGGYTTNALLLAANQTALSYDYAVRYVVEGGAGGAGTVRGAVQYYLTYQ